MTHASNLAFVFIASITTVLPARAAVEGGESNLPLYREAAAWLITCPDWLDEPNRAAILAKRWEREAALQSAGTPDQIRMAEEAAAQREAAIRKESCGSPNAARVKENLGRLGFDARAELVSRAASLAQASQGKPWADRLGSFLKLRPFLEKVLPAYDDLMAKLNMTANWQNMKTAHVNSATTVLTLACLYRQEKEGLKCPSQSQPHGKTAMHADAIVSAADDFAIAYERAHREASAPGGTLPSKNYSKFTRADDTKTGPGCAKGTLVINLREATKPVLAFEGVNKPVHAFEGMKTYPLYRLGERTALGTVDINWVRDSHDLSGLLMRTYLFTGNPALESTGIKASFDKQIRLIQCE